MYKHKTKDKLIPEQTQISPKHDSIFKTLNTQMLKKAKVGLYITRTHNNISVNYQKPTRIHGNNQPSIQQDKN